MLAADYEVIEVLMMTSISC